MFARGAVSAMSLFRGSESRMFLAPLRSLSALSNRASLLRPRFCVGSRSLSSQEATSGSQVPTMHNVTTVDRISLILTRTMKPPIPTEVPVTTMELANSRRRIVVNATMGFLFLFGSVAIIQEYSKRRKEHTLVSLHDRNVQRYEKLKEEEVATETGNEK